MADCARESGTDAECAKAEAGTYTDDGTSNPEYPSKKYGRQRYCEGVDMQYKDYVQSERNLEYDICNIWCSKPLSVLQDYCDAIKVHIFWPLLFQSENSSIISRLHPCVDPTDSLAPEMSLKKLQHIELMEDIVDLIKRVVNDPFFIGSLLRIGYKIENNHIHSTAKERALVLEYMTNIVQSLTLALPEKILAMEEALNWVKYTGDMTILPKLGAIDNCWPMLSIFFTEYKYHITKVVTESYNLLQDFKIQNCPECIEQGEVMKVKGNDAFSKERFDVAIIYYTRAIEYSPENHLLYGNRALCFLRTGQLRNALGDGKRATILKSGWTKGHYRYCDALSMLGELDWALQANIKAQILCRNDPEGIKDLTQQQLKLQNQIEDLQGQAANRNPIKAFYESRAYISTLSAPAFTASLNFVDCRKDSRKSNPRMASGGRRNSRMGNDSSKPDDSGYNSDIGQASGQTSRHKGKQRSRNNEVERFSASNSDTTLPMDLKTLLENQFSKSANQDFANIMKMLRSLIQDGYTALLDQRCRSAAQAFNELLNGLDPQKIKQLNLAMINYVLVVYGLAISLLGIGQPEELSEAENQFKRMIEHYPSEGLDCLAYCGIGKVYLKKNRFLEALDHFQKARGLICRLPGVLTWPTSNVVIEETKPGKIKMLLEKFVEECKFPPVPDAICCYQQCRGYSKIQIYITDPDFKGFIRISCCQYCKIEFHMNCWKKLKTTTFNDKIDKDFLQGICLTPDCEGIISKIIIYSSGGQVKCEFEHKVIKEKGPPKPILKQKCSSVEKLKLKEDKKLKRKIQKQEAKKLAQERLEEDLRERNAPKQEEKKEPPKKCHCLDDRILQCIQQYSEKIRSGVLNPTKLLKELMSWKVLTTEDYTTCFSSRNFVKEAVDFVIHFLIEKNNRVKTRIFVHVLSELKEVEPKLGTWIQKLNGFGLDATGPFLLRYGAYLKGLDFSIMAFLWSEMYGHKLASIEGKQLDYFCEPSSSEEARFLIWLLEENREKFPALHSALDEFFDVMDSRCTVLRKHDSGDVPLSTPKPKNKGKKKKPKDLKPMLVGSGKPSITTNNDAVTSGEDHKSTSSSSGPFVIPEHLRQEVEEFEALYEQQNSGEYVVRNKKLWDINPKQKCSTLYDYFSQMLEEHGPLDMSNKMFSEEYEFFPEETRQILEKAGGLKSFLLACPRFVLIDNCIALKKVASRLKKKRKKKNIKVKVEEITAKSGEYLRAKLPLNPTAREFKPDVKPVVPAPAAVEPPRAAPANASPPKPASEVALKPKSPKAASGPASGSLPEAAPPKAGVSPESPVPSAEDASLQRVSCPSPMQASEAMAPTYWPQPQVVSGYCTYVPIRGFSIAQTPPTYINVITSLPTYASVVAPVAGAVPAEYTMPRPVPVVPMFMASTTAEETAAPCVEGPPLSAQVVPADKAACKLLARPVVPARITEESAIKCQEADYPPTKVAAIQVSWLLVDQEINTEPFSPFEAKLGEISQLEKEYYILQKQLQEACNNYEQKKLQSSEETKDLEEKLTRNLEENKISKTELNWFLQDLEKEIKKWEQEKEEIQDKLKALKKKMKTFLTSSETLTEENAENDNNDQDQESSLDEAPEISRIFAEEKAQVEECIKRGKDSYEESLQRAMSAEVAVLETWKETEMYKLQVMESQAEAYLKNLKLMRSDSAASPDLDSDIQTWESFLSDVRKETEKAKAQFEEQIKRIKNGSRLSDLSKVQVSELSFPACRKMSPQPTAEASGPKDQAPAAAVSPGTEDQAAAPQESSVTSASDSLAGASPTADEASTDPPALAEFRQEPLEPVEMLQPGLSMSSVMEQLFGLFPCFSSDQLAEFIEEVQDRDMMLLSELSTEEFVQRVTEFILEDESDPEDESASGAAAAASDPEDLPFSAAGASAGAHAHRRGQRSLCANNFCEICQEVFNNSKNMRVLSCGHKFHKACLRQWLQEQSDCPVCLELNLQNEE